jgi:hypothetical protein
VSTPAERRIGAAGVGAEAVWKALFSSPLSRSEDKAGSVLSVPLPDRVVGRVGGNDLGGVAVSLAMIRTAALLLPERSMKAGAT